MPATIAMNVCDPNINKPLSETCTPNPDLDNPIPYKGWSIWKWTGWKGCKGTIGYGGKTRHLCEKCGEVIRSNQPIYMSQSSEARLHFKCAEDPNKESIVGQWVAIKGEPWIMMGDIRTPNPTKEYAYASAPGSHGSHTKGGCFSIELQKGQKRLTYKTSQKVLEAAREDALVRLKLWIDSVSL